MRSFITLISFSLFFLNITKNNYQFKERKYNNFKIAHLGKHVGHQVCVECHSEIHHQYHHNLHFNNSTKEVDNFKYFKEDRYIAVRF